ncbi:MAG: hypothetical protein NKF70_00795 [Methanobacterium sp. ERen5]|nr:MAG: hypothetical protein NKF70_00795 [Methanobacterium sp. ERen5]
MIYDRVFLDFDAKNEQARKIKNELINSETRLNYKKVIQNKLQEKLQNLIINEMSKPYSAPISIIQILKVDIANVIHPFLDHP